MDGWRSVHPILAVLFPVTIPPAAHFAFTGDPDDMTGCRLTRA